MHAQSIGGYSARGHWASPRSGVNSRRGLSEVQIVYFSQQTEREEEGEQGRKL